MSHKHGAYLGGIRTVEDLRLRCRIDDDCGCWHWGLSLHMGAPMVVYEVAGHKRKNRGRRAALEIAQGAPLGDGLFAFAVPWCKSVNCVNPRHSRQGTRAEQRAALAASGVLRGRPARIAASVRTSRKFLAKLTLEQAREIRVADGAHVEIAARYGVSAGTVCAIRAGRAWREHHMPGASVFGWRP